MKKVMAVVVFALALPAHSQHIKDRHASVVDLPARQAALKATADPGMLAAIKALPSCVATQPIGAPVGRMVIPRHYLSGSNGAVNPAEAAATRVYTAFETRITDGMNQYVATGNHAESACALEQLDLWAKAHALLDYDREESSQAWYQVEWTLSAAGITDSVLIDDSSLDHIEQERVTAWLREAAHKDISFEKPTDTNNNHHYWRGLAAAAIGVAAGDDKLFHFGIDAYQEAIAEIDSRGAFPKEMARHENATHYQGFALEPLVLIAQLAAGQGVDLYGYHAHGRSIRDAILFFGQAVDDPSLVRPYTSDRQAGGFKPGAFAEFAFYAAQSGLDGLPPAIVQALQSATVATRLGGNTTILAGRTILAGK
jgi:poly(beta-D-mannuronate) lyase